MAPRHQRQELLLNGAERNGGPLPAARLTGRVSIPGPRLWGEAGRRSQARVT